MMKRFESVVQTAVHIAVLGAMSIGVCQVPGYFVQLAKERSVARVQVVQAIDVEIVARKLRHVAQEARYAAIVAMSATRFSGPYAKDNPEDARNARRARAAELAEGNALKSGSSEEASVDAAADAYEATE